MAEDDATPTANIDQRLNFLEEHVQKFFPVGKLYASPRALCYDAEEYGVRHGFNLIRSTSDDDCIVCCANPKCKFRIVFVSNNDDINDDNGVVIKDGSIYRHCTVSGCVNRQKSDCETSNWIELHEVKEFSRLLYTNPVCFLATCTTSNVTVENNLEYNVMILSWLTATNNEGSFMFSLNKHRHTASILKDEFTLSVPVEGMEDLVLNTGGVSGKWGISKFQNDNHLDDTSGTASDAIIIAATASSQNKKRKGPRFPAGIPHLERVSLGQDTEEPNGWPFAVKGTVAHLLCRVKHVAERVDWIDDNHYVVFAKITRAYVRSSYWNASKKLFQPAPGSRPSLTFFGAQTFGYVLPGSMFPSEPTFT